MKSAVLPAVRVEPALRSDAESVLDDGESLSDFIAILDRIVHSSHRIDLKGKSLRDDETGEH